MKSWWSFFLFKFANVCFLSKIFHIKALIPNIYPIALLLALNPEKFMKSGDDTSDELLVDYNNYKWKTDTYLTQNSKYYLQHSNEYNKRYNNFLGTDFECLYDLRAHESLKKLHFSTQTEFQQILLWSNDFKTYTNCDSNQTTPYDINLRCNDFNKILDVLLTKIQSWPQVPRWSQKVIYRENWLLPTYL